MSVSLATLLSTSSILVCTNSESVSSTKAVSFCTAASPPWSRPRRADRIRSGRCSLVMGVAAAGAGLGVGSVAAAAVARSRAGVRSTVNAGVVMLLYSLLAACW